MTKTQRDKALRKLAKRTLDLLTESDDWSPDVLDDIAIAAIDLGLADTDSRGLFRAIQ